MEWVLSLSALVSGWVSGYCFGRIHERKRVREAVERMRRIDPGSRSPGLPTNLDGEPSVVRRAKMRR